MIESKFRVMVVISWIGVLGWAAWIGLWLPGKERVGILERELPNILFFPVAAFYLNLTSGENI